jgi:hypothetical protein
MKKVFFWEFSDVKHAQIVAILNIFLSTEMMYFTFSLFICFLIKMFSVSVKCFIFRLIISFYLFFGQSTGGKGLTIAKDNISQAN